MAPVGVGVHDVKVKVQHLPIGGPDDEDDASRRDGAVAVHTSRSDVAVLPLVIDKVEVGVAFVGGGY